MTGTRGLGGGKLERTRAVSSDGDLVGGYVHRRPPLLVDITNDLLKLLLSKDLRPGSRLPPERQLAKHFGVGRSIIREALKSLSLLGMIEVRQGDGNYVSRRDSELLPRLIEWGLLLDQKSTADLVECRYAIERVTVRLAAERRTEDDVARLAHLLEEMEQAPDAGRFMECDIAFHLAIASASKNEVLAGVLRSLQSLLRVWIVRAVEQAGETAMFTQQHRMIYTGIRNGDPEQAAEGMESHLGSAHEHLMRARTGQEAGR
jgi:GntR family transcriptional repressor for pyruvate dehydrogenase complex